MKKALQDMQLTSTAKDGEIVKLNMHLAGE